MPNNDLKEKVSFKDTLNLPRTDFPIRANAKEGDALMLTRWAEEKLSYTTFECHKGAEKFILHDGPPYANGNIHAGHAYNKILKDIVTKSQRMMGKQVPVTPGWDCHGLPIEQKVSQENPGLVGPELKKKCREYAQKWVNTQREEFKQLGVMMNWDHPYLTMDPDYEASIVRAFGDFVHQGYIEHKNKTVPWCPNDQTVLALSEIEHQERKDPSIYVEFPLDQKVTDSLAPALKGKSVSLLIWTTTPWTLPLNRAVVLKPNTPYVVLEIKGRYVIVGAALADKVCQMMEVPKNVVAEFSSLELQGKKAHHPFVPGLMVPVILDQMVLLEDGTACVHSAPGAGPEDYELGVRNGLEIYSPVGPDGKYTSDIEPKELVGMHIDDGQIWVLRKLAEKGLMLYKTSIRHPYPHCWRCHKGLIFRATKQWFCDLEKHDLKNKTLRATEDIETVPDKSINRLQSTLEGRLEWCLSRQRVWGVPIPALLCLDCDGAYTSKELADRVADAVAQDGIEWWDTVPVSELLSDNTRCASCNGSNFKKEQDILDVWFESGVSHFAVLKDNPELAFPADMYLEGKDQHRAWFQSSLLTSMVLNNEAPMKTIVTHGYTVDSNGRKMSKSLGNVVSPQEMIDILGTDGLRLWVSSIDCAGDVVISDVLMKNVQEVFRKVRNTCRFLLSNLYDFDPEKDMVAFEDLRFIDQDALWRLDVVAREIKYSYNAYNFTAVFHEFADYCASDLSSFYLDIIKDRLYVEKADGHARRSAQTVCYHILDTLTRLMAPILSFTAEQISDHYQKNKKQSIHLQTFAELNIPLSERLSQETIVWNTLKQVRSALLKSMEELREKGEIKHSLEARLTVFFDKHDALNEQMNELKELLEKSGQSLEDFFKEFVIVSQFEEASSPNGLGQTALPGLLVSVSRARGEKCPRCWNWDETDNENHLCRRCQKIV